MSLAPAAIHAARRGLESAYGLALDGLDAGQVEAAIEAAALRGGGDAGGPGFLPAVLDHLPIDESWLFREDPLWEWLRDDAGPALLERALAAGRPARVLSLGCSGGQEAFSAAILLQRLLARAAVPAFAWAARAQVVGIDSSPARVRSARGGALPGWSVQRCRPDWLAGGALAEEGPAGPWRVHPSIQALCRFEVGNVLELAERGNAALGGHDLVFCRHVLIYFRRGEAVRVAAQLARGLDPGATLVFSAAEAHLVEACGLEPLAHLGAGRVPPARRPAARRESPRGRAAIAQGPPPARAAARSRGAAVAGHVRVSLEHARAGHAEEALREARAALFQDPRSLYSRLLLGRQLLEAGAPRGREVLRALLQAASGLPGDAELPCADGLSVGQLAAAVRLLLARPEGDRA